MSLSLFSDLDNHWAQTCILELAERKLIQGYPDRTFRPNSPVTRAEFAALLSQIFSHINPLKNSLSFTDVPPQHWANQVIEKATRSGFLSGYPDRTFKPSLSISRLQVYLALASGLKYPIPSYPQQILQHDLDDFSLIPNYAINAIASVIGARMMINYPRVRYFNPEQIMTRGELIAILFQTLSQPWQLSPISPYLVGNSISFPPQENTELVQAKLENSQLIIIRNRQKIYENSLSKIYSHPLLSSLSLRVLDLDQDGEPEIILDGCTSSNHHFLTWIFDYDPLTQKYQITEKNWRELGYELKQINPQEGWQFITYQKSFDIFSKQLLDSALPLEVYTYQSGAFQTVTKNYPELVRQQANQLWTEQINRQRSSLNFKSILAAYLANKYILNQKKDGWFQLRQLYQGSDAELYFQHLIDTLIDHQYIQVEFLVTPQFDQLTPFYEGFAMVANEQKWGYIDQRGLVIIDPQFVSVEPFDQGRAAVRIKDQYGWINRQGKWIITPQFDAMIPEVSEGLFPIEINGKWGYADLTGKRIIPPQFDGVGSFSEGLALVWNQDQYGYIDPTGKVIIPLQFEGGDRFSEGLARVWKGDKVGYINPQGNWMISPQFDYADSFKNNIARVYISPRWGYLQKPLISVQNSLSFNPDFDYAETIEKGWGMVRKADQWGYVNSQGKLTISCQFQAVEPFQENLAKVKVNHQYGYIDQSGRFVIRPLFDEIGTFVNEKAVIKKEQKYGYINRQGEVIIPPQFTEAFSFYEKLARVKVNQKYGYINGSGQRVIPPQFEEAGDFSQELAPVKVNSKWGYIHRSGKMIFPPQFDQAESFINNYARISLGGKWGFLSHPFL